MFWKLPALSASSPVESILDKENFTLEELLDEEEIIQECKALNSRLIYFLRDRAQVEQLLHYIVDEPPEDAESKRTFKFPFIACEIFTCEIDVILKILVEEGELMDLLFSFLEPNRPHGALLAGYFSKVVVCLMIRKTIPLMNYVKAHHDVFRRLVDLIGITSIMEVLIRLVGADDHVYSNFIDVMQWLADSNLLEMIVDKLSPSCAPEVHANAAETLCAITRSAPSALATKLSSPSFVERIFSHALEDSHLKSSLVHSLSVCISLLDPKRSALSPLFHSFRSQHMYDSAIPVSPDTVGAMLPKLGDLLILLDLSSDDMVLPTTYGELRPPLGRHRLKIVEFVAVLLRSGNESAEKELVNSGTIQHVIDLFFEYQYNNSLHHHVESIIQSCVESKNDAIVDHILRDCDLIGKILKIDKQPILCSETDKPTVAAAGKRAPRAGNIGHITRISNKLVELRSNHYQVQACLQENCEWNEWQTTVLHERDAVENVNRWACGRPTALQDRTRDSDEEYLNDRDYDVAAMANNLSQALRYKIYGNEDAEEDHGTIDRDDEDVYFDDESAEVVISSLRLGGEQASLFTKSNWFAFQDDKIGGATVVSSPSEMMEDINVNGTTNGGNSINDDEVVVGEDDVLAGSKGSSDGTSSSNTNSLNRYSGSCSNPESEKVSASLSHENGLSDKPLPDWVGWSNSSGLQSRGSSVNPFDDVDGSNVDLPKNGELSCISSGESMLPNGSFTTTGTTNEGSAGSDASQRSVAVPSLFEDDVEFVGVELEGTEKAMEQVLKEGIVGEAGPLKRAISPKAQDKDNSDEGGPEIKEFNDANYWRVDQEVAVLE